MGAGPARCRSRRGARRSMPRLIAVAIGIGLLLGAASRFGNSLPEVPAWLFNGGAPWLLVAFFVGAGTRSRWSGSLFGALTLACAVVGYFGYARLVAGQANLPAAAQSARPLLAVALVGGPLLGCAGGLWRDSAGWPRTLAVAALSAVLTDEAVFLLLRGYQQMPWIRWLIVLELALAVALPWLLLGRRGQALRALLLAGGLVVAGLAAISLLALATRLVTP